MSSSDFARSVRQSALFGNDAAAARSFSPSGVMRPVWFRGIAPPGSEWPWTGSPWPASAVGRRRGNSARQDRVKGFTDNVADLMAAKLSRLPTATQKALGQLACLGNVAKAATLAVWCMRRPSRRRTRRSGTPCGPASYCARIVPTRSRQKTDVIGAKPLVELASDLATFILIGQPPRHITGNATQNDKHREQQSSSVSVHRSGSTAMKSATSS
jgi:hypothetical protein